MAKAAKKTAKKATKKSGPKDRSYVNSQEKYEKELLRVAHEKN